MIWTLDTCGFNETTENCRIEVDAESWTFIRFIRKCPAHANISDDSTGFSQLHQENTRGKSNVEWEILQNAPTALYDINADGIRTFKQGITVTWNWTGTAPNRILNAHITGINLTQNQINAIKAKLDSRFGITNVNLTFG